MATRRKPCGPEYAEFVTDWKGADHKGKIALAERYGVTYDSAKHWVMEGPSDPAPTPEPEPEVEVYESDVLDELLMMPSKINLDFVSFDLETSNLKADFSILLSAVVKPYGQTPVVFRADAYPAWQNDRSNDYAIVRDIATELAKHAVIITHYGSSGHFDLPYLRAKMVKHGLPILPPMFGIDTYRIAKANFAVSSRRLKSLGYYFGLGDKTDVEGSLWNEAAYNGSKEALDQIVEHNVQDCVLLENLAALGFPYLKSIPKA